MEVLIVVSTLFGVFMGIIAIRMASENCDLKDRITGYKVLLAKDVKPSPSCTPSASPSAEDTQDYATYLMEAGATNSDPNLVIGGVYDGRKNEKEGA